MRDTGGYLGVICSADPWVPHAQTQIRPAPPFAVAPRIGHVEALRALGISTK